MRFKKINEIFGYGFIVIGILKILLVLLVFVKVGTNIITIFDGGNVDSDYYSTFSMIIALVQIVLSVGSFIMIILNIIKKEPAVVTGYLCGLGVVLIEIITPPLISLYIMFLICSLYIKSGSKIINNNIKNEKNYRKIKQDIKNTEWFYSVKEEIYKKEQQKEIKEEIYIEGNKFIKENSTTILLVFFIAIILLMFIMLIAKTKNNHNNKNIDITKVGTVQVKNVVQPEFNENENVVKGNINIQSNNSKLNQIANYFNNSNFTQKMRLQGYTMDATVLNNRITVCSVGEGITFKIEFVLNDNILSTKLLYNNSNPEMTLTEVLIASSFIDCIGQMSGNSEGELLKVLMGEECTKYTLEKEGIEIKNIESTYDISIKVDLNSNFIF